MNDIISKIEHVYKTNNLDMEEYESMLAECRNSETLEEFENKLKEWSKIVFDYDKRLHPYKSINFSDNNEEEEDYNDDLPNPKEFVNSLKRMIMIMANHNYDIDHDNNYDIDHDNNHDSDDSDND